MELDIEILRSALAEMKTFKHFSYAEIQRESGVSNITRIVSGEVENPTLDSWHKLHLAFPEHIPAPSYKGGKNVNVYGKARNAAMNMTIHENKLVSEVSAEEQVFLNLLRSVDLSGKFKRKFMRELMDAADNMDESGT